MNGKPATGYDFGNKKAYRRTLWNLVDTALHFKKPQSTRKVLILDTSDAEETLFLIARGYRPENITVVNRNAAELAWLTRRLHDRGINGVKTIAKDVFEVVGNNPTFDAINLDLTSPMNIRLAEFLRGMSIVDEIVIAVSVLRGRETDVIVRELYKCSREPEFTTVEQRAQREAWFQLMRSCDMSNIFGPLSDSDFMRLTILLAAQKPHQKEAGPLLRAWGRYRSSAGSQTMMWTLTHWLNMEVFNKRMRSGGASIKEVKAKVSVMEDALDRFM